MKSKLLLFLMSGLILTTMLGATNAYAHDATGDESCGTLTAGGLDGSTDHTLTIDPLTPMEGDDVTATADRTGGSLIGSFRVGIEWSKNNVPQQSDNTQPPTSLPYSFGNTLTDITPGTWVVCAGHNEDSIDRIHFDKLVFTVSPKIVGGELIPIETTSLILAGAHSFSWMIPVVLSGIGIGLFVVSRKSENS